ncbi:hypothetical protein [Nocardia huaxiensis]|uniref:Outer membrane channel protein CpnT-like N-terminal domain-containing protein n=1 Tax=Nocardia huaxiensis TaxID=2755382 RepID=A0A7D6VD00_9NOCA|nr:hypothetical protein [Nocardia huaxiensis]QLY29937.1 hypothetical protein H0264_32805 [Nocardia huaxiensis]UFS96478.1 hypothetical protein LPY97_00595 [Nocardia huaxiensis]
MYLDFGAYYAAGKACSDLADALQVAFLAETYAMGSCGGMAGVDEEGVEWGKDYDQRVTELLTLAADLGEGLQRFGKVIIENGYTHYLADYNSVLNPTAPPTAMPATPTPEIKYYGSPPSAGGPSGGLRDDFASLIKFADEVGIPVPDGDTDKLQTAADAWKRLQTNYTANLASVLTNAATVMDGCDPADAIAIAAKLRTLQTAVDDILGECGELSQLCSDYKADLHRLRKETIETALNELGAIIATEWAVGVLTSWVTFGVSALAAGVATATTVSAYGARIARFIREWREFRQLQKANRVRKDLTDTKAAVKEAKQLGDDAPGGVPKSTGNPHLDQVLKDAEQIGKDVKGLPKGSGKPDILAGKLTDLKLPHDDAVQAAIRASESAFGEVGGTANAVGGGTVILPKIATQNIVLIVKENGSVIAARGNVVDFIAK